MSCVIPYANLGVEDNEAFTKLKEFWTQPNDYLGDTAPCNTMANDLETLKQKANEWTNAQAAVKRAMDASFAEDIFTMIGDADISTWVASGQTDTKNPWSTWSFNAVPNNTAGINFAYEGFSVESATGRSILSQYFPPLPQADLNALKQMSDADFNGSMSAIAPVIDNLHSVVGRSKGQGLTSDERACLKGTSWAEEEDAFQGEDAGDTELLEDVYSISNYDRVFLIVNLLELVREQGQALIGKTFDPAGYAQNHAPNVIAMADAMKKALPLLVPASEHVAGDSQAGEGIAHHLARVDFVAAMMACIAQEIHDELDEKIDDLSGWGPFFQPDEEEKKKIAELQRLKGLLDAAGLTPSGGGVPPTILQTIAAAVYAGKPIRRTFKEQCFLLAHIQDFAAFKQEQNKYQKQGQESFLRKRYPYVPYSRDVRGEGTGKESVKANASLQVVQQPWGFMNKLTQTPGYNDFFNIENKYLSQLSPKIRLYKVTTLGGKEGEVEINFNTHYDGSSDLENIFKNKDKRGFGVGIKSFDFTYHGSDPFAVKKAIKAKLVIFASSFDELIKTRVGKAGKTRTESAEYRYADLALKTGQTLKEQYLRKSGKSEAVFENLEKLNFRLKAVVGWNAPRGRMFNEEGTNLKNAIGNSFVTLNLTPTIHEFGIDEMGRVTFTINYLAYVEEFFDDLNFNIFSDPDILQKTEDRKMQFKAAEGECDSKDLQTLREKHQLEVSEDLETSLQNIMRWLLETSKIGFVALDFADLDKFNKTGPYFEMKLDAVLPMTLGSSPLSADALDDHKEALDHLQDRFQNSRNPDSRLSNRPHTDTSLKQYINYVFLGDIVDAILEMIEASLEERSDSASPIYRSSKKDSVKNNQIKIVKRFHANYKRFRVVLGPVELRDPKNPGGGWKNYSLGQIPISVAYFMEWLTEKVLAKEKVTYTLSAFLRDLLNDLIRNFLNTDTCYHTNIKQKTRLFQSVVTSFGGGSKREEIMARTGRSSTTGYLDISHAKDLPILNIMGVKDSTAIDSRDISDEFNYLIFYAGRTQPKEHMRANQATDTKNGIFHFILGKDRGIIKNISLTKTNSPGLQEVRYEMEGYDGLAQLMVVYDATITCYGTPNTVPGTYIYIDPRGFAPNTTGGKPYKDANGRVIDAMALTRYGVGGYYMIITSENSFAAGKAETIITAKWVAAVGEQGKEGLDASKKLTPPEHSTYKCSVQ